MARPIWKDNVMFGLISVPVVLYNAEQRSELHFKLLGSRDQARVRYERVNVVSGEPVPWEDVAKGYEFDDGNFVIVGDEYFKRAAPEASQTVEIEDFVKEKDVPIQYYDKPYYLVSGKRGEKGYVLLRETLRANGVIGIGRVVIRTRQYLAAVVPRGNALCLDLMRYDHELRKPDEFELPVKKPADYKFTKWELDMAEMLVESMTAKWNPSKYKDDYREKSGSGDYLVIHDLLGLIGLLQIGALEIHPWGCRTDHIERPDRMIFDLDPDAAVAWDDVKAATLELRALLEAAGLECFLKTSGSKGLHVIVPLARRNTWDDIRAFSQGIAAGMAHTQPTKYIANMSKAKRKGKIYVDYVRNSRRQTSIAPYSSRAREGAAVSVPIRWDELKSLESLGAFTVLNMPERLKRLKKDPWENMQRVRQSITKQLLKAIAE